MLKDLNADNNKKIKVIEDITVTVTVTVVEVLCFNAFYCAQFTSLADQTNFQNIFFVIGKK